MRSRRPPAPIRKTWPAALAVLAVALFYSHGLSFINARVPGLNAIAAGTTIDIGHGATFQTVAGWAVDRAKTKPADTAAFMRDGSAFALTTFDWKATEGDLIERTHRLFEALAHLHVRGDDSPFRTAQGLEGKTYAIHGPQAEGRVWLIVLPGQKSAIAARVRSPQRLDEQTLRDARSMLDSLKVQ